MTPSRKPTSAADRALERVRALGTREPDSGESVANSREASGRGVLGRLERALGTGPAISRIDIDPARVRVWALQGRLQDSLDSLEMEALVASIREFGQFQPAIVRPIHDPHFTHEVLDGSRRRWACEKAGVKLAAYSREMTDREAAMVAQTSDDQVKHSTYEVGLRWQGWLEAGIVRTASELAELVRIDKGDVSRCLNVASAPRAFLQIWGDHQKVPRPAYRRIATVMATAKAEQKVDEVKARLESASKEVVRSGEGAKGGLRALALIESDLRPDRTPTRPSREFEIRGRDKKVALTVKQGKGQIALRLERPLPTSRQSELAKELGEYAAKWLDKG